MSILVVGLNHKTAPVEVRERLAFKAAGLPSALTELVDREIITEGLIVSTCNRVELITSTAGTSALGLQQTRNFLYGYHNLPQTSVDQYLYHHSDEQAVKHIFRVAASLDSLVMGESQILGQVKDAYTQAVEVGTVGRSLNKLMHRAFTVAKRVRTETGVAANSVSIGYIAVELAKKVFDDLEGKTALLVGAGEMAELALRNLQAHGARNILIANRTLERAQRLSAEFHGRAIPFDSLYQHMAEADIVLVSTDAPTYVVTADKVNPTIEARRHRPLFMIDISVPRNLDPQVSKLDNVFAFDIDDLEAVVQANLRERQSEALRAEAIIDNEVTQFLTNLRAMEVGPVISALKEQMTEQALAEYERHRRRLGTLTPEQETVIKTMLSALTNKFSHPLIVHLRQAAEAGIEDEVLESVRTAYRLNGVKREE